MLLLLTCKPGKTVAAAPLIEIPRAAVVMLLLLTSRLLAVAPAPTPVITDVIAAGAVVAEAVEAPGPARMPKVVFSLPVVVFAVPMFLPVALGTIAGAHVAGRWVGSRGSGRVSTVGLLVSAAGTALPVALDGTAVIVVGMSIAATGLGAVFVCASTTALSQVGHHEAGIASGILSTFHEFGAALGVAATSSLAAASIAGTSQTGITRGLTFAAVVAVVTALVALVAVRSPEATIKDMA